MAVTVFKTSFPKFAQAANACAIQTIRMTKDALSLSAIRRKNGCLPGALTRPAAKKSSTSHMPSLRFSPQQAFSFGRYSSSAYHRLTGSE